MVDLEYNLTNTTPLAVTTEDELLPGLPNALVLCNVLPRILWHTRPIMRAVSKPWKKALESPPPPPLSASRIDTSSRSNGGGLLLIHQNTDRQSNHTNTPRTLSLFEETTRRWRRLPPLPVPHGCGLAATQGKVFVIGGYGGLDCGTAEVQAGGRLSARGDVLMLDMKRGDWQWKRCKSMKHARYGFHCRAVGSKIYVVGGRSGSVIHMPTGAIAELDGPEPEPEVYDIDEGQWEALPRVLDGQRQLAWSGLCRYTRLAMIGGSDCLVARGYWETQAGSWTRFCSLYNPKERRWVDMRSCVNSNLSSCGADMAASQWSAYCSDVCDGQYDLREGVLLEYKASSRSWQAMAGRRVYESLWVHLELDEAYDDHYDDDDDHFDDDEDHFDLNDYGDDDDRYDNDKDQFNLDDDDDDDYDNDKEHFYRKDDDHDYPLIIHNPNEKFSIQKGPSPLLQVKLGRATHLQSPCAHQLLVAISTCAHDLVSSPNHKVVYVTLCKGDTRFLSLWQGQIDPLSFRVAWSKINFPGSLYLCSGMCALEI